VKEGLRTTEVIGDINPIVSLDILIVTLHPLGPLVMIGEMQVVPMPMTCVMQSCPPSHVYRDMRMPSVASPDTANPNDPVSAHSGPELYAKNPTHATSKSPRVEFGRVPVPTT
jgi:hypothetical protein